MFQAINGWTKETMKARIHDYNYGTCAVDANGTCCYQTSNGNRCAVGAFIPDDHRSLAHKSGARSLLQNYPDLATNMPLDLDGLIELQHTHDVAANPDRVLELLDAWIDKNVQDPEDAA